MKQPCHTDMKMLLTKSSALAIAVFLFNTAGSGRQAENNTKKKQVTKEIELPLNDDARMRRIRHIPRDTSLLELLVTAVNTGKITPYHPKGSNLEIKMSGKEFRSLFTPQQDTLVINDGETGKILDTVVQQKKFRFEKVTRYRVTEEWVFNSQRGQTDTFIRSIAPVMEWQDKNGNITGTGELFRVKYSDAKSIVARYEHAHTERTLRSAMQAAAIIESRD